MEKILGPILVLAALAMSGFYLVLVIRFHLQMREIKKVFAKYGIKHDWFNDAYNDQPNVCPCGFLRRPGEDDQSSPSELRTGWLTEQATETRCAQPSRSEDESKGGSGS